MDNANVEIAAPLKYLCTFCRTFEMPLINCEINLMLNWSANFDTCKVDRETTFAAADTKLCILVVILSTQDKTNLFEQLTSGFKRTVIWKKYLSKASTQAQNQYLDYQIDPNFQGHNISVVEIKDFFFIITCKETFGRSVKSNIFQYEHMTILGKLLLRN